MTDILLFFVLLIIVLLLGVLLITGSVKLVNEYVPPFRGTGFSEPARIRDCGVYQTFSIETDIVDNLVPIPYNSDNPYLCQDGSLKQLAKYSNTCLVSSGCIGVNGTLYQKNQKQYFYQSCGSELNACDTLGVWFLNPEGLCLDVSSRTFTPCTPTTTLLYDNTIRVSTQNKCLLDSLALADCSLAPNWFYSDGFLCTGQACLSTNNNGTVITVPTYQDSNLHLFLIPAR